MTLEDHNPPLSLDEAIQYGREEALDRMLEIATAESARGDGRALRALQRLIEAAGLRRKG